jgi:hypothetical protein
MAGNEFAVSSARCCSVEERQPYLRGGAGIGRMDYHRRRAFARLRSRPTPPSALSITGQNTSRIAKVVIEPTRPFDQNTVMSPAGADHRQPERILGAVAEHQRQRERREGNADLLEDVADDAEAQHNQMSNIAFWIA